MRGMSLFTGAAGFEQGFNDAGIETIVQCEIDTHCQRLLAYRYAHVPLVPDVRDTRAFAGYTVNVAYGGFPCQDASIGNSKGRTGLQGSQTGLWWAFRDVLSEVQPEWVVAENVSGLLTTHDGYDFKAITDSLVECGYGVAYRVLDAQHFGVAQQRRSVFVVGRLGATARSAALVLGLAEGCGRDSATLSEMGWAKDGDAIAPGFSAGIGARGVTAYNGANVTMRSTRLTANEGPRYNPNSETFIVAEAPLGVRILTLRERERLMGWPDDWTRYGVHDGYTIEIPATQRWRMTGNGVCANVARWLGRRLVCVHTLLPHA